MTSLFFSSDLRLSRVIAYCKRAVKNLDFQKGQKTLLCSRVSSAAVEARPAIISINL